jgi:transposase
VNAKTCQCGCGRPAKKKWFDYLCRMRYRNARRTPEKRAAEEALTRERKLLERHATHTVEATVHRVDDERGVEITRRVVRVAVPRLGMFGL